MAEKNSMSANELTRAANNREEQLLVGLENLSSELARIFKCGEFYTNPAYVIHKLSDMKNMYEPDSCMHKVAAAVEAEGLWLLKTRGNIFVSEAKTALAKRQAADDGSEGDDWVG